MSVSDKYASRKAIELQSLIAVNNKIQEFIEEQIAQEASLADALDTNSQESIMQKMKHIQNQVSYNEMSSHLSEYMLKATRGNAKILQAYQREQEGKGK